MARSPKNFEVGIDSYSLRPLGLSAFECLDWAAKNGAQGVQFSEVNLPAGSELDEAFLRDLARSAAEKGLYLEWGGGQHIPFDLETGKPIDLAAVNRRAAGQARALGASAIRSCSGGLMRWRDDSPPTDFYLKAMAESLAAERRMFEDLGVTLAVETHFEFTSFEILRVFEMAGAEPGGFLGVCLDTMNLLTMLEDPVMAARRLLPWVVMTHIKDGGILLTENGVVTFPVTAGEGIVDFDEILRLLVETGRPLRLSLEDHGGEFLIPIFDADFLSRFPDLTPLELARLLRLSFLTRRKVDAGRIGIVERRRWPEVCEDRVRRGLRNVREIAGRVRVSSGERR